jgi:hypothetical protein
MAIDLFATTSALRDEEKHELSRHGVALFLNGDSLGLEVVQLLDTHSWSPRQEFGVGEVRKIQSLGTFTVNVCLVCHGRDHGCHLIIGSGI